MTVEKTITTTHRETIDVENGLHVFKTFDICGEDDFYYKINITPDPKFSALYDIKIESVMDKEDIYQVKVREVNDSDLPWYLRNYFSGEEKIERITEDEFNKVKQTVLERL